MTQSNPHPSTHSQSLQDPRHPFNWANKRKWTNVALISAQAFLSPMSSTIMAVGSRAVADDFHLTNIYLPTLPVGAYVLGLGLGPLYLAPLSELRGRRIVYLISFTLFTILNVGCALAPDIATLSVLRFLSGACGSAGPTLGGASIGDMFERRERGKVQSIYSLGPTAGPIIGPLIGAFVVNRTHGWRWLMWIMVIASGVTVLFCVAFLKESYAPFLLRRGLDPEDDEKTHEGANAEIKSKRRASIREILGCAISRPFKLLLFSPICSCMSLYMALIYGILYLQLVTTPLLYGSAPVYPNLRSYRFQHGLTGLAYLGSAVGTSLGLLICGKCLNPCYEYMQRRQQRQQLLTNSTAEPKPENRMVFLQVGMTLVPVGLVIFGWTAEKGAHWAVPLVGSAIFAMGMLMAYVCIQTYVVDVYERLSASALAAVILARCSTSCVFAVTGFQLYRSLGYGWGTMVIALICVVLLPIPAVLYKVGPRLRKNIPKDL